MELPSPPFFEHLLLESPWPLISSLLALAAGLVIIAFRRVSVRHLLSGAALAVVAAAVALLATFVTTDREKVKGLSMELVKATAPLDAPKIKSLFEPDAAIVDADGSRFASIDEALARLMRYQSRATTLTHYVTSLNAQADDTDYARTVLTLISSSDISGNPTYARTQWLLTWHRDASGQYHVSDVRWISIDGKTASRIRTR
jgi:ketosteroid isomerase-like protein